MKKNEGFHTEELGKRKTNRISGGSNSAQIGAKLFENSKQSNLSGSFSFDLKIFSIFDASFLINFF